MTTSPGSAAADGSRRGISEERILAMLQLGGFAYTPRSDTARAAASQALARWVDLGLGVRRTPTGERLYDPVEVVNFFKKQGREHSDPFWSEHWVATGRRLHQDLKGRRVFSVVLQRTFPHPAGGRRRLRVPLPLPKAGLRDPQITYDLQGAGEMRISRGRLEARVLGEGREAVSVSAAMRFSWSVERGEPAALHEAEREVYTRAKEGWIVVTPLVAALAWRLAPAAADARTAAAAYWDHLLDHFFCGAVAYEALDGEVPLDALITSRAFDCQMGSALLVALCRARGLPARLVSGYLLYTAAPTNHFWAEIWFEDAGWTPFDLLAWDLSRGGRDPAWRRTFFGWVDPRIVTQILPRDFTGEPGVDLPAAWRLLQHATLDGVSLDLVDLDGRTVYADRLSVSSA